MSFQSPQAAKEWNTAPTVSDKGQKAWKPEDIRQNCIKELYEGTGM